MTPQDYLKIHDIALSNTLNPDIDYHYRQICRWYSKNFSTPLHVVHELPPGVVLLNYYEAQMADMEEEDLDRLVFRALNPDTDEDEEEEIQDFIKMVEAEETRKGRLKPKSGRKQESLPQEPVGAVNRSYDDTPPPEAGKDSGLDSLDSLIPKPPQDAE